jgi:hypothetical protein
MEAASIAGVMAPVEADRTGLDPKTDEYEIITGDVDARMAVVSDYVIKCVLSGTFDLLVKENEVHAGILRGPLAEGVKNGTIQLIEGNKDHDKIRTLLDDLEAEEEAKKKPEEKKAASDSRPED